MFVSLPWPRVSTNHMWRKTRWGMRLSDAAIAWKNEAILAVRASGQTLPSGLLAATYWLYRPNLQTRDVDNYLKLTADSIFAAFGADDTAIDELHAYRRLDRKAPRIEVELVGIGEEG